MCVVVIWVGGGVMGGLSSRVITRLMRSYTNEFN